MTVGLGPPVTVGSYHVYSHGIQIMIALEHPHRAAILDDRAVISDEWLAKEAHRAANSDDLFRSRLQKVVTARKMAPFCQPGCNPPPQPAKQHAMLPKIRRSYTEFTFCLHEVSQLKSHGVHFLLLPASATTVAS